VSPNLQRRVEEMEARRKPAERRVRYVWWDRRQPLPKAAPGERLVVISWAEEDLSPTPGR
jgi:hypothetical protein